MLVFSRGDGSINVENYFVKSFTLLSSNGYRNSLGVCDGIPSIRASCLHFPVAHLIYREFPKY